jgi:hypothetical protein
MKLPLSAGSLLNVTFETEPSEAEDQIAVDYSSLCHLQKVKRFI